MSKTILLTGATDGIGLATANGLIARGHRVVLHGRSASKLDALQARLGATPGAQLDTCVADLSDLQQVQTMAEHVLDKYTSLDVLINNAGVFHLADPKIAAGYDVRFVVNACAPCLLTQLLLPALQPGSRVINLSSAAQETVSIAALQGREDLNDFSAYAQSKLALTMWSHWWAQSPVAQELVVTAVNPGSMLGTKMVQQGFGVAGADISIGSKILVALACDEQFGQRSGRYFDNDKRRFADPHHDVGRQAVADAVLAAMSDVIATLTS